ncbi:MAG TPA: hypothetical protein VIR29_02140 [Anseongella sp.]
MKRLNLPALTFPALLALALLMIASCARSPYSFVKVQPKRPFESPTPVNTFKTDKQAIRTVTLPGADAPSARFNPSAGGKRLEGPSDASARNTAYSRNSTFREQRAGARREARREAKEKKAATRKVVERELNKSSAFSALPAKKFKKVEKIISKQAAKIAKKKAASPAGSIGFNQWMKIGVILLLVGLVVGIAFADLGYIVAVIGVVFLVLGLIQQL